MLSVTKAQHQPKNYILKDDWMQMICRFMKTILIRVITMQCRGGLQVRCCDSNLIRMPSRYSRWLSSNWAVFVSISAISSLKLRIIFIIPRSFRHPTPYPVAGSGQDSAGSGEGSANCFLREFRRSLPLSLVHWTLDSEHCRLVSHQ